VPGRSGHWRALRRKLQLACAQAQTAISARSGANRN
jgi:hypothetical protein